MRHFLRESGIIETMDNLLRQAFCSNTNDSLPQNDCRFVRPSSIQTIVVVVVAAAILIVP